jgi:hypothetical protein
VEPLRAFLRSYRAHSAGAEHELIVLLNGVESNAAGGEAGLPVHGTSPALTRAEVASELHGVEHRLIELDTPLLDLAAYGEVARQLEHERLCFLNSYSVILADGWLHALARVAAQPDVGLAGATGSWESRAELVNGSAMHWIYQLVKLPSNRRGFPRFPNPHIRTTAFMLKRDLALTLGLERAGNKNSAYLLESGRHSITRQLQARGLRAVVVGRDGREYDCADWARSGTFRAGEQENLLVADNRTCDWQRAAPELRRILAYAAWRDAG